MLFGGRVIGWDRAMEGYKERMGRSASQVG